MPRFPEIHRYLSFLLHATSRHYIHSPFVYDLVTYLEKAHPGEEEIFKRIETSRSKMLCDRRVIRALDLGAGPAEKGYREKRVCYMARHAAVPPRRGRTLFRLVHFLKPGVMLELGTSLGVGALYQASGNPAGRLITVEGCPDTAALAGANFRETGCSNIEQVTGDFHEILPGILQRIFRLDYLFVDGNHSKVPALEYFNACLGKTHEETVFVFDDIYWSRGMQDAWREICRHPRVTLSIDLFRMGMVFFRRGMEKQHFRIRM